MNKESMANLNDDIAKLRVQVHNTILSSNLIDEFNLNCLLNFRTTSSLLFYSVFMKQKLIAHFITYFYRLMKSITIRVRLLNTALIK